MPNSDFFWTPTSVKKVTPGFTLSIAPAENFIIALGSLVAMLEMANIPVLKPTVSFTTLLCNGLTQKITSVGPTYMKNFLLAPPTYALKSGANLLCVAGLKPETDLEPKYTVKGAMNLHPLTFPMKLALPLIESPPGARFRPTFCS
jgi:hypothetical protein